MVRDNGRDSATPDSKSCMDMFVEARLYRIRESVTSEFSFQRRGYSVCIIIFCHYYLISDDKINGLNEVGIFSGRMKPLSSGASPLHVTVTI